jgi:hypothetical protein
MKSRQSHIPLSKRKKGALRFSEAKQISTIGQTSRQAKQFASGIMGKYGFDRNNYLGMFALIFKSLDLLKDKKLAASQTPSDRAWVLQLQLQLQSLKHPESAHLITRQQTIRQLQQLVEQSGHRLPKEALFVQESQSKDQRVASTQETVSTEKPAKKRGRKSKKDKVLERNQLLAEQQSATVLQHADNKSKQVKLNDVNKGNSPIIVRSMKQLAASIGMLAHSRSSKTNKPNTRVNGAQHRGKPAEIQQKALHLLYKQALRDESNLNSVRTSQDQDKGSRNPSHTSVAQHVEAIRSTSEWLDQFQAGKLSAGKGEDASAGSISSVKSAIQTQPSFLNVAKLVLQEVTHTRISHKGASQTSSFSLEEPPASRSSLMLQSEGNKKALKLGEGPFSDKVTPSTVRFIQSLLLKHAEQQELQGSRHSSAVTKTNPEAPPTIKNGVSVSKGFLASSQQPMAINAASLMSRLPRSMHATAGSSTLNRSGWSSDPSMNRVWRKQNEQLELAERQQSLTGQHVPQSEEVTRVLQQLQLERDEVQMQTSELSKSQVNETDFERNQEQRERNHPEHQQVLVDRQEVQLSDPAANVQVEQPVKRKRGRPRKNNPIVIVSKEMANEAGNKAVIEAMEQSTSQQQLRSVELNANQLPGSAAVQQIGQKPVAAKRVAAVTPSSPAQVFRRPAAKENGRTDEKIQSNESFLQQLVTIQRQPSSNETWVRSTNSVTNDVLQAANAPMAEPRSYVLIKPDLGATVIARSQSDRSDQRLKVALKTSPIISRIMNQNDHPRENRPQLRQLGQSTVSHSPLVKQQDQERMRQTAQTFNRVEPFVKANATFRSPDTNGRKEETARLHQSSQQESARPSQELHQDQLKSEAPVGIVKQPSEELVVENAMKAADASLRSMGTLLPPSSKESNIEGQGVVRPRTSLSPSEIRLSRLANQQSLRESEENVNSMRQGKSVQTLAAEIAAKVTQASLAVMRPNRTNRAETGLMTLQRRLRENVTPSEFKNSNRVGQRQVSMEPTIDINTKSNMNNVNSGVASASASIRESDQKVKPITDTIASPRANTSVESGIRKSGSQASIDLVRRAGSPSRVDRVREQQATIQRKIDLGSTISRQPVLRLQSQSPIISSEEDRPAANRNGSWTSGQLTLRAGLVENGTITRRTTAPNSEQQSQLASEVEQGQAIVNVSMQANTDEATALPTKRMDGADSASAQVPQPPSTVVLENIEKQKLELPNATAVVRSEGDDAENKQQPQLVRDIVQGSIVQRSVHKEHRIQAKQMGGSDNGNEPRKTSSITAERLIQRLSGTGNGIQVRRANSLENVQPLGRMNEVNRVKFVQRMANSEISGLVTSSANEVVNRTRQLEQQIGEPENGRFVQGSTSAENRMLTQRAVAEEAARQLGQRAGNVSREFGQQQGEVSEGSALARTSVDVVQGVPTRPNHDIDQDSPTRRINRLGQSSPMVRVNGVEQSSSMIRANGIEQGIRTFRANDVERSDKHGRSPVEGSNFKQRVSSSVSGNVIQRASETRMKQLINRVAASEIKQGLTGGDGQLTAKRRAGSWTEAGAEHIQRRVHVDSSERPPMRETNGSESPLDTERFQVDMAEQTIRAMVSAQVEERAQALEPAAASRAADVAQGARSARAPRARQNASMTPRVMPLLASSAGALRAAPAVMAAASPAAAEHRLPAHGTGSLTLAAAAGKAAVPTAGVLRTASITNSSSQGWAATALTKPLPTQVQRQVRPGAPQSGADVHSSATANGVAHQSSPLTSIVQMQSRMTQPPAIGGVSQQSTSASSILEHKQAPTSQLASEPLEMDWRRTRAGADEAPAPAAPVEQTPPELSEEQIQELIKQLPQLDIAKIADKVYREIEKKMKFERQRRGV